MSEGAKALLVQFPHPGREWGSSAGSVREWTQEEEGHGRKFLAHRGRFIAENGQLEAGDLTFWGEWEARSAVTEIAQPSRSGPSWIHRPLPGHAHGLKHPQNTDPFVFGAFLYSLCRQASHPTLRSLPTGSVILFGSTVSGDFLIDTVFVVGSAHPHTRLNYVKALARLVPAAYWDVSLRPWYRTAEDQSTLYVGATIRSPIHDMYSFVPCQIGPIGSRGFARPRVTVPEVNPESSRNIKILGSFDPGEMRRRWDVVVEDVTRAKCLLGVGIDAVPWPTEESWRLCPVLRQLE